MRCAVMWSGGKDSALAADRARRNGAEIACLVNFYDEATGRVRFHATRTELIAAQADAMAVPLVQRGTAWHRFDGAFGDTLDELVRDGIDGIVFGDIHLADVRAWYETRVRAAGLTHVEPLWGEDPGELLAEFVATGGRAVVTCCESEKLDDSWLGRVIDERPLRPGQRVRHLDRKDIGSDQVNHAFLEVVTQVQGLGRVRLRHQPLRWRAHRRDGNCAPTGPT